VNPYGKSALEMFCPHCNAYAAHPVVRTDARSFHMGGDTVAMFKRIAGRDISWRQRLKRCITCDETFHTVEMAEPFLFTLVRHVGSLQMTNETLRTGLTEARKRELQSDAERKEMHAAIRKASKLLNRQLPKRKKKQEGSGP
jgi:transcriptional regulator NrdR family protein